MVPKSDYFLIKKVNFADIKANCISFNDKKPSIAETTTNAQTKVGTRYGKGTSFSKSQKGQKGISMKYDISQFIAKKNEEFQKI